jgi:hypothetical protein
MAKFHPHPWHKEAIYGPGFRVPLDRERKAVWTARLRMFRRGGHITALHEFVGLALVKRLGVDGRLDPSHDVIADDVGCCPRSVRNALCALKSNGLLTWVQRIVRVGWIVQQLSNAYVLSVSEGAILTKEKKKKSRFAVGKQALPPRRKCNESDLPNWVRRHEGERGNTFALTDLPPLVPADGLMGLALRTS